MRHGATSIGVGAKERPAPQTSAASAGHCAHTGAEVLGAPVSIRKLGV
jgi:hypothetical protein